MNACHSGLEFVLLFIGYKAAAGVYLYRSAGQSHEFKSKLCIAKKLTHEFYI